MSEKRRLFLIFIFTLFNIFLVIGFLIIKDAVDENNLKNEIRGLGSLDIYEDRFNNSIKSRGDYEKVELAIKNYYDEYAVNIQSILSIIESDKFKELLLIDNLKNISSNYVDSFEYIKNNKNFKAINDYNKVLK